MNDLEIPKDVLPGFDMKLEQAKDEERVLVKNSLEQEDPDKYMLKKYLMHEEILYYISNEDETQVLMLVVPAQLRSFVIKQYHDKNGHMGVLKTFDAIRREYFWSYLFKELHTYVSNCSICQTRSLAKTTSPIQETDIPPFPCKSELRLVRPIR